MTISNKMDEAPPQEHLGSLGGDNRTLSTVAAQLLRHQIAPIILAVVAVAIALSVMSDAFLTPRNISNLLLQSSIVGVAAVGATLVIVTGGIDLSVGAVVGLSGMVGALLVSGGMNPVLAIGFIILFGGLCGLINGLSVSRLGMTPFIVTLAVLGVAQGLTLQLSKGQSVYDLPASLTWLGGGKVFGLPVPVVVTAVVFLAGIFILNRTTFGHKIFAVGGNREAARLAGIRDRNVIMWVYVIAGLCAGLSALLLVGRLGSATPTAGQGLELQVIAAVVIGGTSLFGGKGSLIGTFMGVLLIAMINNGLTLLNVNPYWIQIIQGSIIFLAVLLDAMNSRRRAG